MTTLKNISYETAYNRHIRNARKAATGLTGYARAKAIADYFKGTVHPHVNFTFNQMALNRTSDHQFAIDLLNTLADLTARNEEGYYFDNDSTRWKLAYLLGTSNINNMSAYMYSTSGREEGRVLIAVCSHDTSIPPYSCRVFDHHGAYVEWLMSIGGGEVIGTERLFAICKAEGVEFTQSTAQ